MSGRYLGVLLAGALTLAAAPVFAATLDAPTVTRLASGHGKIALQVTAGPSGAPSGFAIYWMKQTDYDDYGDVWPDNESYPALGWAHFTGVPTLNTFGGSSFVLGPNESVVVEIGDLADESGLTTNSPGELDYSATYSTDYVFCTWAIGGTSGTRSDFSLNEAGTTVETQNCTFTQGYWKTHSGAWPVSNLTLGTVNYTQAQLLQILNQAVAGNGLISLAHQLIAAKLNIANGADGSVVNSTIAAADALIGGLVIPPIGAGFLAPSSTASLTQTLDDWNNGITGPGHCADTPARSSTWGALKSLYR
jgi:hypothetical protein